MGDDFRSFRRRFVERTPLEKVLEEWDAHQRRGVQLERLQEEVAKARANAVTRRGPGRPAWTQDTFFGRYRQTTQRLDAAATDKEIAAEFGFSPEQLRRLVRRFGRPAM